MSPRTLDRPRRGLTPLIAVTAAALVFAVLLVLVRLQWAPLESADHGAAAQLNSLVAGHAALVTVVKAVTWLGSDGVLWTVVGVAAIILALRRRWRLAIYLLVTGAGALVLDPILKSLVGRLRPVVAHPIAHGTGNSFPSGHSLGSIVCYGAILLVFLPAARGRWRAMFITAIVALIALIGISRILLGVHFLSDVIGAWAVGIVWLGITAFAFELTRRRRGPAGDRSGDRGAGARGPRRPQADSAGDCRGRARARHRGRIAAGIVVAWVLILGIVVGFGELVTKAGNGNVLGDRTIPHWFAAHRTPGLTRWSLLFSTLGATTGDPRRVGRHLRRLPRRDPALAAGHLHRHPHGRGTRRVPRRGRRRQAAPAGRPAPRPPPADLRLSVRADRRHDLPLCRGGHPGYRPRPRLVAVAVPDPRDRHAGRSSRSPGCTAASTTRPTSSAACCSPRSGSPRPTC